MEQNNRYMNKFALVLRPILCLFSPVFAQELTINQSIDFKPLLFEEAKQVAKKEGKAIFMDVYAVWCIPCKQFEKTVFTDKQVGEKFNASFINLKIDAEKGEGKALAKAYNVGGYPTGIFVNEEGILLSKFEGVVPKNTFLIYAENALKMQEDPKGFEKAVALYSSDKQSLKSIQNLLHKALLSGNQIPSEAMDTYFASCTMEQFILDTADIRKWVRSSPTITAGQSTYTFFLTNRIEIQKHLNLELNFLRNLFYNSLQNGVQYAAAEKNLEALSFILKLNEELPLEVKQVEKIDYELDYFQEIKDWPQFIEKMNTYCHVTFDGLSSSPKTSNPFLAARINNFAWNYLLYADNQQDLAFAEKLMEKCISLDSTFAAWYDTLAGLIYKQGDATKAILTELKAVSYSEKNQGEKAIYLTKIERMKRGEKTWLPEQY